MAQLDAIRYEIRSLSLMNPGPMTRRLMESPPEPVSDSNGGSPSLIICIPLHCYLLPCSVSCFLTSSPTLFFSLCVF